MSDGTTAPSQETDTDLARDLSLFDITVIGVGAMIGAGIFVLTGLAAGQAGLALVMAFAFNGFITIFTGMVYAELGSALPKAGGGYHWVEEALGRSQSFIAGWISWFAHAVAGSLYTLGFGSFVHLLLERYFAITLFDPINLALVTFGPDKLFAVFAGVPDIPIIGILTKLGLAVYLFNYSPLAWYGALAWILAGVGIFFLYSRSRVRETRARERRDCLPNSERRSNGRLRSWSRLPFRITLSNSSTSPAALQDRETVNSTSLPSRRSPSKHRLTGRQYIEDEEVLLEQAMKHVPEDSLPIGRSRSATTWGGVSTISPISEEVT